MTERPDKITAEFIPAPQLPPPPHKIVLKAPNDRRGHPVFPDLHLSIEQAQEVVFELMRALEESDNA